MFSNFKIYNDQNFNSIGVSNNISPPLVSKGDIIVESDNYTVKNLPIGTNGQFLTVDLSQNLGMKWVSITPTILTVSSPINAIDSNGIIVSGTNIQLEYATSTEPGILSTGIQTIAGSKIFSSPLTISPVLNQLIFGTTNTITINAPAPVSSRIYILSDTGSNDTFTMNNASQTLTNKTITSTTNNVIANGLNSATTQILVNSATAPTIGQVLTATSPTTAVWSTIMSFTLSVIAPTAATDSNGLIISAPTINLEFADNTHPGIVSITTQTFGGSKTFSSALTISTVSNQLVLGTTNTTTLTAPAPASSITLTLPSTSSDVIIARNTIDSLTNKTITSSTNNVYANAINSATTAVIVNGSTAPTANQILVASSSTTASWQSFSSVITIVAPVTATDANGIQLSGNTLNLEYATSSEPGIISTGVQTIAGSKTLGSSTLDKTIIGAASSVVKHQINGGINYTTNTISSSTYTIDSSTTDYIIYTNSTSNAITITLPSPTNGRILYIYDMFGTAVTHNITIVHNLSETINGLTQVIIASNYGGFTLSSNGTNWFANSILTSGETFIATTATTSYTTPINITPQTRFKFTLVGAGGGGAYVNLAADGGSGGGGGAVGILFTSGLSPNTSYTIAIGTGGAGGTSSANGVNGGSTTLTIGATTYTVGGGGGATNAASGAPGTGGITIGLTINMQGGTGNYGGTVASTPSGRGGNCPGWGSGGGSQIDDTAGKNGTGFGGGGGGGHGVGSNGGNGTNGMMLIEWNN